MSAPEASGPPRAEELRERLQQQLQPSWLEVIDESASHAGHVGAGAHGYGTHFRVRIAGPKFDGLSRLARHRLVYDSLHDFMARGLHALDIETKDA